MPVWLELNASPWGEPRQVWIKFSPLTRKTQSLVRASFTWLTWLTELAGQITFFLGWRQVYKSAADYPSASPGMNIRQCLPVLFVLYDYGLKEKKIVGGTHALQKQLPYPDCQVNCNGALYATYIPPWKVSNMLQRCKTSTPRRIELGSKNGQVLGQARYKSLCPNGLNSSEK